MEFEWDQRKNEDNELKHGVAFEEAVEAFDDASALRIPDRRHSAPHEKREILIGRIAEGVLVVVFTLRHSPSRIRIISARRADKKEERLYENAKNSRRP